jgi:serine/threonine-protein kinase
MAPEQASGENGAITVAADIYGLGAILYELLTGRPPFQGTNQVDTIFQVVHTEPPRPRQIAPGVPRDLETIVLKCLQKEPGRRYGSARELADDLRRWLRGEPIQARPVGSGERLLRWVRRQPVVAGLMLALAASLVLGLGLTGWQWYRAEQHLGQALQAQHWAEEQRVEAERQAAAAEVSRKQAEDHFTLAHHAVNQFTRRVNEELDDIPGLQQKRRSLLENALKYYEQFLQERGRTPQLVREQADTWGSMAQIHSRSGERARAVAAYREALALYRELHADAPKDPAIRRKLASTLNNIAINLDDGEQARAGFLESLGLVNRFLEDEPDNAELLADKSNTLNNLGSSSRDQGKVDEARDYYEKARTIQEQLVKRFPRHIFCRADLASTVRNLAVLYSQQGKHDEETLSLFREACDQQEKLARNQPGNYRRQAELASAYLSFSLELRDRGDLKSALEPLLRSIDVRTNLVKQNPDVPRFQCDLAHTITSLGVLYSRRGDRGDALLQHERACDLLRRLIQVDSSPRYRQELALALFNLGACYASMNHRSEERQALQQSREYLEALVKAHPDKLDYRCDLGRTMSNLGLNLALASQTDEGVTVLHEGLEAMRPAFEKAPQLLSYRLAMNALLGTLGEVERSRNRPGESVAAFLEREKLWPTRHDELFRTALELMRTAATVGRPRTELTDQEKAERQRYCDLAMDSLQRAVKHGFSDSQRMQKETDLELLRQREDCQKLLSEMTER